MAWKLGALEAARLVVKRVKNVRMDVKVCIVTAESDMQRITRSCKMRDGRKIG
jgi:hypothetical protein